MTIEEARKIPITKLGGSHKDDYEIRLIVWETLDVPLNGGAQNIQVQVTYDPSGWSGSVIEKRTDIHYNSKTGRGEFNWRFKFELSTTSTFPRLRFKIIGNSTFSVQSLGEATMDLKKTVEVLKKEGRLDIAKTMLNFNPPG